jgi:hypothetical protein
MSETQIIDHATGYVERLRRGVIALYKDDPLGLAEHMGILLPEKPHAVMKALGKYDGDDISPGIRELVEDVCSLNVLRAGVKAPRGGGKSLSFSFIEFFLNCMRGFDWLNLGGSETQALQVYGYLKDYVLSDYELQEIYPATNQTFTENTRNGAWIRVLAASQRSIRSPHAGGNQIGIRKNQPPRGGGLTIDEECECEEAIVKGAKPTVNTAVPSVILRGSTFHKLHGTFQALIDNAEEVRYKIYEWDCFDICQKCVDRCEECIPDFREDIYQTVIDENGMPIQELLHKAYCGGKAHYADGWMLIEEIKQAWIENADREWFETEMMGNRPSQSGFVIKNLDAFNKCLVPYTQYLRGYPCVITIDWGLKGECCVQVWQEQPGGVCAMLEIETMHMAPDTFVYEIVAAFSRKYFTRNVRADSSHPYCNYNLANEPRYRMNVYEVNFQMEKERGVGAINAHIENGLMQIPESAAQMIKRAKNWRRKNGKIEKKDDHEWDSAICFFSKFAPKVALTPVSRAVPIAVAVRL